MPDEKKLIERLRGRFGVPNNFTDEEVLSITDGILYRALIELNIAVEDLKNEIVAVMPESIKKRLRDV